LPPPGVIEGYEWMGGVNEGTASFTYGSPESVEGLEFRLTCEPKTKGQGLKSQAGGRGVQGQGFATVKTGKLTTLLPEKAAPRPLPSLPRAARSTR